MKKLLSFILAVVMLFTMCTSAFACKVGNTTYDDTLEELQTQFVAGKGPETDGYTIDYRYFSPVEDGDTAKYPLVIWLHGMGDGAEVGRPVQKSNVAYWSSDEFQARFKPAGGAFILAARSREENGHFWSDEMVAPLRAAIDAFIAENKDNIDLTRIYVGGYSMGGKMTLKMAVAYPEMFAAAFPICPAWSPAEELCEFIADVPVWITSSTRDPLVNYYMGVTPTWEKIIATSNNPEDCRLSTLTKVCYEDGKKTSSSHHAWYAVNHDMFSAENGNYPYMSTVNGVGEEVILSHPDGMISWLTSHTSDYNGEPIEGTGNLTSEHQTENLIDVKGPISFLKLLFTALFRALGIM